MDVLMVVAVPRALLLVVFDDSSFGLPAVHLFVELVAIVQVLEDVCLAEIEVSCLVKSILRWLAPMALAAIVDD